MKKGSNAVETVRECASDLWRKGAAMQWPVPEDAKAIGALCCPIIASLLPTYLVAIEKTEESPLGLCGTAEPCDSMQSCRGM